MHKCRLRHKPPYHPDLQSYSALQGGVQIYSSAGQVQILLHIHKKRTGKNGSLKHKQKISSSA